MWDRMQRGRPMRNALLLLLSLILAANCVWAVQGLAAWRCGRGLRPEGSEQLMLQRLNATVLSVEVRQGCKELDTGRSGGQQEARLCGSSRAAADVLPGCLPNFLPPWLAPLVYSGATLSSHLQLCSSL